MTTTTAATGREISVEVGYQDTRDQSLAARLTRWTEQATGHRYWTFQIVVNRVHDLTTIAEAVYAADNAPHDFPEDSLTGKLRAAMQAVYAATTDRHHSLSVGDRVRVGEVEVVCADAGWERIYR
jgi:hypothetical protein